MVIHYTVVSNVVPLHHLWTN